ncbi:MAG: type II toxin-antitoxin system RelE/ParE family toxin [Dehalococcoidia bacterium]
MYRIDLRRRVLRQLESLPGKDCRFLVEALERLEQDPRPSGVEKIKGTELWRIRRGDYRAVYHIDDVEKIVTVVRVGHGKDIYRGIP